MRDLADQLVPGDPPIDNVSMLEVCNEARIEAIAAREHALKMMRPFALRALLDGHDPHRIAAACGFGGGAEHEHEDDDEDGVEPGDMYSLTGLFLYKQSKPEPLRAFTKWLQGGIAEMVKEAA